jgi:hypothetical protein
MKSSDIVHGGGWVKCQFVGRPKTRLFVFLSLIWLGVSICASAPFWLDSWPPSFSGVEWLCLLLMLPEPVFIVLAIVFALTEQPKSITEHIPNPDYDIRKLY